MSQGLFHCQIKIAPDVKSHDYHVLVTQMIIVGIRNILPINVREAIMNFFFFFNAISLKVPNKKVLKSLEKGTMKLYASRDAFSSCFFDISIHFSTHLIKEMMLLGPVFPH
jgi:hypothetical protein